MHALQELPGLHEDRVRQSAPGSREVPRLVATDLDGTLLGADGSISPRTVAALRAVTRRGGRVVFATGRPARMVEDVIAQCGCVSGVICLNGAVADDLVAGVRVSERAVRAADVRQIVGQVERLFPRVEIVGERGDGSWVPLSASLLSSGPASDAREDDPAAGVLKILAHCEERPADEMRATLCDGSRLELEITQSGLRGVVEITSSGVTKANALEALCRWWSIDLRDVVAFGDMPNDIEMLRRAGIGIAVASAHREVLAVADDRCGAASEDGVAAALARLFGFDGEAGRDQHGVGVHGQGTSKRRSGSGRSTW